MSRVEERERQIGEMNPAELRVFREWFAQYDAACWDRQIEADAKNGKLDRLAKQALDDHHTGRTKEL